MGFGGDLEVEDGDFRVEPANVSWEEIFYHGFFGVVAVCVGLAVCMLVTIIWK